MNRPPAPVRGPEAIGEDLEDGLETLEPLTPAPARPTGPEARPPWGRLEGFAVRAVLSLLEAEGKDCTMTMQEGGRRALVHLRAGRPVHAECGSLAGRPAFDDVVGWPDPVVSIARLRYEGPPTLDAAAPAGHGAKAASGGPAPPRANDADTAPSPYARLLRLAEAGETGELVVAHAADEFHVHLQRGRVVWVSERHTRDRFRKHLLAVAGTRDEDLQPVLEECRRSRLPLVETLVQRSLATPEQLRETFAAVFRDALADLRALPAGSHVFLRRGAEARHDMSFALRGLEPALGPAALGADAPRSADAVGALSTAHGDAEAPPSGKAGSAGAPPETDAAGPAPKADAAGPAPKAGAAGATSKAGAPTPLASMTGTGPTASEGSMSTATPLGVKALSLDALVEALESAGVRFEGVCLTRGLAIVPGASPPAMVPSPGLLDLMGGPANDRAELVTLRAPNATVLGQRIGGRPLVAWCKTRPEACAAAQAVLARLGGAPPAPPAPAPPGARALRLHHDRVATEISAELTKLFTDNVDLLSALIVDASARSYVAVDGASAPPLTWMLRRALSSAGAVGPLARGAPTDADAPPLLGAHFAEGWWFGGPLAREPGYYGWLLLQPGAAQALGWLMAGRFCRRFGLQPATALDA